jgi:hypothetical protein
MLVILFPQAAAAYVGPGSGITVIGAALAFIGAILLAIVGFIWYPLKRAWRAMSTRSSSPDQPVKSGR